ncbi:hypothetical protein [Klebsiella michiganensis]|uniref:hypothetical protein n=1 Tax=Klebsiella michiganensis TaxID=1134687 RepID=UPI001D0E93D7|nr:hypothetical protein [Klebsiella michiganensis]
MTVSTEVDHNDYTGNGVTTSFPYTFRIFQKTDLMVQVVDLSENITVLTLDTDYSVTGAGTYSGGSVVLSSPLANGWQISISRELPATQETDLRNQGKFFAEVHEDAFDKLTMLIQQCFSFLRLALRKPSFIANYYDALNNRIRNLRDPSQSQDAATKNYVDGQIIDNTNAWKAGDAVLDQKIDANFRRSLRVPDSYINELPSLDKLEGKILAFSGHKPIGVLPESGSAADVMIELAANDGASHIGGIGFVSPEMFGYLQGVSPDAVPYYQAAVDAGHARGLPVQLTGKYYATTFPHKVTLPGDDGTAYPGWVAAGNDANIAAESENHIYAAIRLYPDSVIIGDSMQNCALIGDWDSDTPVINNNQHIGYFISGDSSDGYIRPQLVNHGVRNFFIGRYGNGVLDRSTEDNFLIRDCCLTGWFMGADSVCNGFVVARDCFTGDAYGGAWTQRNAAVTIPYLPPYPAAEIFKVGWVDAIRYTKYHFYGKPRLFGPADQAIDTWFDTYIYKSANSARTSAGGRLTNNTASGYSARSFPGIAGRAFTVLSRYGRAVNGVCLDDVKVLGTHRVPFYTDAGSYNVIHTSYVEKTCLVDTTTTTIAGNQFYTDYQDPWNATLTKAPAMVCEGGITVDRTVVSAGVATHPFSQKPTTINGPLIINPFRDNTEDYTASQIAEWNSAEGKTVYLYDWRRQYSVQRPIRFFDNTQEAFQYYKGVWTPVVKCGSEVVTLNTTVGTYRRSGRLVHATFRIETTSMALATGGAVVISGLPFTVAALSDGGLTVSPIICSRAGSGIILAQTNPTTKDILLLTNSSPAAFSITGGTGLTIYGSVQYVLTE